jgi:hypothetical protein
MDTDTGRTRRFVRWLKDKIENKRNRDGDHDPWWVTLMLDLGRPAVAVMILTMCAPGEHYLGMMAGWTRGMAWLTPASLTAYAGISAVVATKRPKDAPGHKTAVTGAVLSIGLAMAAQPVAHLYQQGLITGHRFALTIVVSVIPAAVFGHLLHMGAASPKPVRRTVSKPVRDKSRTVGQRIVDKTLGRTVPDSLSAGHDRMFKADNRPTDMPSDSELSEILDSIPDTDTVSVTPRRMANGSMRTVALSMITDNPEITDSELTDAIFDRFGQDSKANSVYVAIKRARKEQAS